MAQSKITTPQGFRAAIEDLADLLDVISSDQAASLTDQIKGAAPKASRRFAADDLEDLLIEAEALKNRLRRKWKRQRRNNMVGLATASLFGAVAGLLSKFSVEVPAWVTVTLVLLGAAFGLFAATSLASSSDWRDEVARPISDVVDILSKELADATDSEGDGPYREQAAGSTRTRIAPTIESDTAATTTETDEAVPKRKLR